MDQYTCQLLHQDFSKHLQIKINKGALKIITRKKNINPDLKELCPKIDDILLIVT